MSADNGWVIQRKKDGNYTLQMYFASSDNWPDPEDAQLHGVNVFATAEGAVRHYRVGMEHDHSKFWSEYGLMFNLPITSEPHAVSKHPDIPKGFKLVETSTFYVEREEKAEWIKKLYSDLHALIECGTSEFEATITDLGSAGT